MTDHKRLDEIIHDLIKKNVPLQKAIKDVAFNYETNLTDQEFIEQHNLSFKDMQQSNVGVVIYYTNPYQDTRLHENYQRLTQSIFQQGYIFRTVECVYGDDTFQTNAEYKFVSKDYINQKQRCFNLTTHDFLNVYGCKKIIFVDASVQFHEPNWIRKIASALNYYFVAQGFSDVELTYIDEVYTQPSSLKAFSNNQFENYHTSCVWGFNHLCARNFLLYDFDIYNTGFFSLSTALMQKYMESHAWKKMIKSHPQLPLLEFHSEWHFQNWCKRVQNSINWRIGYVDMKIKRLQSRFPKEIPQKSFDPFTMITRPANNVMYWKKDTEDTNLFNEYMKNNHALMD